MATIEEFWVSLDFNTEKRRVNERLEGNDHATRRNIQGAGGIPRKLGVQLRP